MLRIHENSFTTIGSVSYRDLSRTGEVGRKSAPVMRARVAGLPSAVAGIVVLADLQGSGGTRATPRLPVFDALDDLIALDELAAIPPLQSMIVVSAGDLYAHLDLHKRGGSGDVRECWLALAKHFRACVGVAGNHDRFGESEGEHDAFSRRDGICLLENSTAEVDGIRFAGICGVIGDPERRPFRHTERDFHAAIDMLVQSRPDMLVMHEGPVENTEHKFASPGIRTRCARLSGGIVAYGHNATPTVFEAVDGGAQFLSVHERIVVLTQ